jgi:hypothetical protein
MRLSRNIEDMLANTRDLDDNLTKEIPRLCTLQNRILCWLPYGAKVFLLAFRMYGDYKTWAIILIFTVAEWI